MTQLELVDAATQKAGVFTKALQASKWPAAISLMGLTMTDYKVLASTNTCRSQTRCRRCRQLEHRELFSRL